MLDDTTPLKLVGGQTRSIPLCINILNAPDPTFTMKVTYAIDGSQGRHLTSRFHHRLTIRDVHEPHKLTFLHPVRIVSYAIIRAPSKNAIGTLDTGQKLPVLLNLHGAGLESDSDQVRHMLDRVPDLRAFVLFPSGVTPWSGDDWHDWGFSDVTAAVASIAEWISHVGWSGPHADLDRWLVSGHSNGGQGALYALTHHPDKIIGAAPVAGYLSIQKYVPYQMWHEAESRVTQVIQSSLQSFSHELMVENFMGIPVLHQHGRKDDNVPAFHSRRLHQLSAQTSDVDATCYVEQPSKGHWYDGVMTTPQLIDFYNRCLAGEAKKPILPLSFQVVVSNPADTTSRGGLQVDQLLTPDQLGRVKIEWDAASATIHCKTSNIRRFHFVESSVLMQSSTRLFVDGQKMPDFHTMRRQETGTQVVHYSFLVNGTWTVSVLAFVWTSLILQRRSRKIRNGGELSAVAANWDRFMPSCTPKTVSISSA